VTAALDDALAPLHHAERRLVAALGPRASLDPSRAVATPLPVLGARMLGAVPPAVPAAELAGALARVALCQLEHFPQNLFWDLDYLAASMARAAAVAEEPRGYLWRFAERMEALHAAYGVHSPIRFRYVHDFIYGFDWERWVAADAEHRAGVGPFDLAFLERSQARGGELAQAIAQGDPSYPPQAAGQFRNPFGFSRSPADELRLHRELLGRGLIPVCAFDADARPEYRLGSSRAREALARELGLSARP
jgi:hypothetical protein